jgi:hypothetical protein
MIKLKDGRGERFILILSNAVLISNYASSIFAKMDSPKAIRQLADQRLKSAQVLLMEGLYDDAFYLVGYVVELELKAKICETLNIPNLFDEETGNKIIDAGFAQVRKAFKTHDLKLLLWLSGLRIRFDQEKGRNPRLMLINSLLLEQWNEGCRYKPIGHCKSGDIGAIIAFLTDPAEGVVQWIRSN